MAGRSIRGMMPLYILFRNTHGTTTAAGRLGVLTAHAQSEVMAHTAMVAHTFKAGTILAELVVKLICD